MAKKSKNLGLASMKTGGESPHDPFDLERLRRLIELMEAHDLGEIDLQSGDEKVKLRRGSERRSTPTTIAPPAAAPVVVPAPTPAEGAHIVTIKAPMVGTFYNRPNPEAEPFVKVGQRITAETVVCIIEAMKVFNEIPAETSGQVVAMFVENGQPVDFGKPLFKIDTST